MGRQIDLRLHRPLELSEIIAFYELPERFDAGLQFVVLSFVGADVDRDVVQRSRCDDGGLGGHHTDGHLVLLLDVLQRLRRRIQYNAR